MILRCVNYLRQPPYGLCCHTGFMRYLEIHQALKGRLSFEDGGRDRLKEFLRQNCQGVGEPHPCAHPFAGMFCIREQGHQEGHVY